MPQTAIGYSSSVPQVSKTTVADTISVRRAVNQPTLEPGIWVCLQERPNDWSHDRALLLCECAEHEWVAWIPDYGEATIHSRQFTFETA
jgi:hypothetical protein